MIPNDAVAALELVFAAFEDLSVRYYIGDSLASTAHGKGRMTQDVDVVTDLRASNVESTFDRLDADFYVSLSAIESAVTRRSCFNAIHKESFFKIDLFVAPDDEYDQQAFERRERKTFSIGDEEHSFYIASAEDTILAKLRWFRLGNEVSQTQWSDILGVMAIKYTSLDTHYLTNWAGELKVLDLLEEAQRETPS